MTFYYQQNLKGHCLSKLTKQGFILLLRTDALKKTVNQQRKEDVCIQSAPDKVSTHGVRATIRDLGQTWMLKKWLVHYTLTWSCLRIRKRWHLHSRENIALILWWSAVTAVSIDSSLQCWVSGWIQSAFAAARATVLGGKGSQSNPLAKTGVPDASTVMIHTEGGAGAVYFGSPGTDIAVNVTTVFTVFLICILHWHRRRYCNSACRGWYSVLPDDFSSRH